MEFKSGKEMYDYLCSGSDLYSPSTGLYAFEYNDAHAICVYTLSPEEVAKLSILTNDQDEYWGGHLGIGGSIFDNQEYDDDEHRYSDDPEKNKLYLQPSFDFCDEHYNLNDWMDTYDVSIPFALSNVRDVNVLLNSIGREDRMTLAKTIVEGDDYQYLIDVAPDTLNKLLNILSKDANNNIRLVVLQKMANEVTVNDKFEKFFEAYRTETMGLLNTPGHYSKIPGVLGALKIADDNIEQILVKSGLFMQTFNNRRGRPTFSSREIVAFALTLVKNADIVRGMNPPFDEDILKSMVAEFKGHHDPDVRKIAEGKEPKTQKKDKGMDI